MEKQENTPKMTKAEWTKKLNEFIEYDNKYIGTIKVAPEPAIILMKCQCELRT